METILCASFCGSGKTHVCKQSNISVIEIEYWKYKNEGLQKSALQKQYIKDVKNKMGCVEYILLSTDVEGLKLLNNCGFNILLVYPDNSLRGEYLDRYIKRDSPYDFIGTFMKYWDLFIDELKEQNYCQHIVLKSGEYLSDYL